MDFVVVVLVGDDDDNDSDSSIVRLVDVLFGNSIIGRVFSSSISISSLLLRFFILGCDDNFFNNEFICLLPFFLIFSNVVGGGGAGIFPVLTTFLDDAFLMGVLGGTSILFTERCFLFEETDDDCLFNNLLVLLGRLILGFLLPIVLLEGSLSPIFLLERLFSPIFFLERSFFKDEDDEEHTELELFDFCFNGSLLLVTDPPGLNGVGGRMLVGTPRLG